MTKQIVLVAGHASSGRRRHLEDVLVALGLALDGRATYGRGRSELHDHQEGVSLDAVIVQIAKYGVSLTLATQTLRALASFDQYGELRAKVFGNTDHLFVFNCSAEDARLLAPELGSPLEPADLIELGDYQCYARLSHAGERLPTFHLRLDTPPAPDPVLRALLVDRSDERYGRRPSEVAAARDALLDRIARMAQPKPEEAVKTDAGGRRQTDPDNGRLMPTSAGDIPRATSRSRRSDHRQAKPKKTTARAAQLNLRLAEVPIAAGIVTPANQEEASK
jgi:hypothetical protein